MTVATGRQLGDLLRSKREELSLSLREVESATSIRIPYLQAIEEGRTGQFLSGAYSLGFLKQYSSFLGFEIEKLSKEYPDAFRMPIEKQDFAYGIGTLEMRGSPQGGARLMPNLLYLTIGGGVLAGAYFFAKFLGVF
jgi:cytoskeletal protein RodZ